MLKIKKILLGIVIAVFAAGIGFNTYAGIRMMNQLNKVNNDNKQTNETLEEFKKLFDTELQGDVNQEDDVTISGGYEIKSTTHISDAYKTGNTDSLSDKDKEVLDMASEVLDDIISDDMTDYEKELAVYEWMTTELRYDNGALVVIPTTQEDCDNPYGVLKYHNAVCVGYATTFRLFMQMMDIECMVVHNSERYHSWNLVKLDDEWYHTDIYSDSDTSNYANFNVNDAVRSQEQSWNTSFFPAANGIKYNYGYQNRRTFEDVYDIPELISELYEGENSTSCFLEAKNGFSAENQAIASMIMDTISERISYNNEDFYEMLTYTWIPKGEDDFYLDIIVTKSDSDGAFDYELSDDDYNKINEAVNEYFPDYDMDWGDEDWSGEEWGNEDWGDEYPDGLIIPEG